jgi:uncharacterized protein (DUF1501 family)
MERRKFIKNSALASLTIPFMFKNYSYAAVTEPLFNLKRSVEDKVLVLICLNGGNDGLNTVIPMDFYANLYKQRTNIILPENKLIQVNPKNAFHPAMTGMANLLQKGKLSVVQNVGYPVQNRSHFRSTDIWTSGSLEQTITTGWLGRNFDNDYPGFPEGYPDETHKDPFAISMGYEVSATCQGVLGNFSHTVNNPNDAVNVSLSAAVNDGTYYGSHMEFLSTIIAQTNKYGTRVLDAAQKGNNLSKKYDSKNQLATQLKYVAQMISGGLKTNVYVVNIPGFDTHDSQVLYTDTTLGNHANLLQSVSDAIEAFQDDLTLLGLDKRVAGMTFSEFGRQIASNASFGTDHGDAAPLFLFGTCLETPIYGNNPIITDQIINQEGVPMEIDFRDVYASILKDWFEVSPVDIQKMFAHEIKFHQIIGGCTLRLDDLAENGSMTLLYPNPVSISATLRIATVNEFVKVSVYSLLGQEQQNMYEGMLEQEMHKLALDFTELPAGNYILRIQKNSGEEKINFVKLKA